MNAFLSYYSQMVLVMWLFMAVLVYRDPPFASKPLDFCFVVACGLVWPVVVVLSWFVMAMQFIEWMRRFGTAADDGVLVAELVEQDENPYRAPQKAHML